MNIEVHIAINAIIQSLRLEMFGKKIVDIAMPTFIIIPVIVNRIDKAVLEDSYYL